MLKIGVVSDTHLPRRGRQLPPQLLEGLKGVDRILHAGDINRDWVLYELEELAPVEAVAGNTDDQDLQQWLGMKRIIRVGEVRIGLVHGHGESGTTLERARRAFRDEQVQGVVFGHSHIPFVEEREGILYLNPGSPTDKRRQEHFSFGVILVEGSRLQGEIRYF